MIRVCYSTHHPVGPKVIGGKEPFEDLSLTSGICEECFPKDMEDLQAWTSTQNKEALSDPAKRTEKAR